jgi:hypothetical protein
MDLHHLLLAGLPAHSVVSPIGNKHGRGWFVREVPITYLASNRYFGGERQPPNYFDRSNTNVEIAISPVIGFLISGVWIVSRLPSSERKRVGLVPVHSSFHAMSTLLIIFRPCKLLGSGENVTKPE